MLRRAAWINGLLVALVATGAGQAKAQDERSYWDAFGGVSPAQALETDGYWDALGDTTLVRLIEQALEASPTVEAAEARIRGASADRFEVALDLAPTVTAVGGYTRQQISGASFPGLGGTLPTQDLWEAGLQMSWELDVFGRTRHQLSGRDVLLDAAGEDARDTRVLLSAEVAQSYFRLRGAQARLAVARRNADNQRQTLAVTVERLEGGRGTALDTERASAQLSSTLAQVPALEAAVAAEQHLLSRLVGRAPGTVVGEGDGGELPALPEHVALPDVDGAIEHRPDVMGARHRFEASTSFVGAARANYLPRLSLQGAAGYTASDFDALGSSGTPRYAFGPVVSWPLLDLTRVKSRVERARAGEREARAVYDDAVLRARAEVATSHVEYQRSREQLQHLADAAEASERAAELARLRFVEGAGDFLEVLDSERRLLEAQDRLVEGRTAATNALVRLYRALGGEWPQASSNN